MTQLRTERWQLPSVVLPSGDRRDVWIADGRISVRPITGAEPLPGRFALPGLVDAHAHIAVSPEMEPLDREAAERTLALNREQGVLLLRDLGAPKSVTLELRPDGSLPRLQAAGRFHARAGRFFPPLHDPVEPDDLLDSALAEISRGARWVKILADWSTPELTYDAALIGRVIGAAHEAGARVAIHTQWEGVRDIVAAGPDSIEHGCGLDAETLAAMARRGIAWTPTLTAFSEPIPPEAPDAARERQARWLDNYRRLLPVAASLGVSILAGTDVAGSVTDEVRNLIAFGLSPIQALESATITARAFLGEPSIDDGAPADVVTFDEDPREDPSALERPAAVVLDGIRVR